MRRSSAFGPTRASRLPASASGSPLSGSLPSRRATSASLRGGEGRGLLLAMGVALEASRSYARPQREAKPARLTALKRDRGLKRAKVSTFKVERPGALRHMKGPLPEAPDTIHVLLEPIDSKLPAPEFRLVIAAERQGDVVSVKDLYSR